LIKRQVIISINLPFFSVWSTVSRWECCQLGGYEKERWKYHFAHP